MEDNPAWRMEGRTDGGHLHPFLFFLFFLARGRGGAFSPSQPILDIGRSGNKPDPGLFFLYTLCVSLLCRFFSYVLIKIPIFLLAACVGEEIKLARVGVYIGVLDLPWIGP